VTDRFAFMFTLMITGREGRVGVGVAEDQSQTSNAVLGRRVAASVP
jgi:hypothetical protein